MASSQGASGVFVGRDEELALVAACAEDAAAGRSRLVWVEGEAGSGKTSLLSQATRSLPAGFRMSRAKPTSSLPTCRLTWRDSWAR